MSGSESSSAPVGISSSSSSSMPSSSTSSSASSQTSASFSSPQYTLSASSSTSAPSSSGGSSGGVVNVQDTPKPQPKKTYAEAAKGNKFYTEEEATELFGGLEDMDYIPSGYEIPKKFETPRRRTQFSGKGGTFGKKGGTKYKIEKATENALFQIYLELRRKRIDTSEMVDYSDVDPKVKKVVEKSNLIDSSWKELIKSKAIVNPSEYIGDRAEAIKKANRSIAEELNEYYKKLTPVDKKGNPLKDRLPENKIKELLERKLITSASDHYAEINTKYPINNLAVSLQKAITSSRMQTIK